MTRNGKDRVFINIIGWILINIYLAKKFFMWGGEDRKSAAEVQESIAMALINNQFLNEARARNGGDDGSDSEGGNDPEFMTRHPLRKKNMCRHCFRYRTIWICEKCSNPQRGKPRKELGPNGNEKLTHSGYMHFCRKGCYAAHDCGNVCRRRTKATMEEFRGQI